VKPAAKERPQYRFYLQRRNTLAKPGWYSPSWIEAISLTIVAATEEEAVRKAADLSGDHGPGRRWDFRTLRVEEVEPS